MRLLLRASVLTPSAQGVRFLRDALLTIEDGIICKLVAYRRRASNSEAIVDLRPALLVPGMVDAHLHFPQTRIIGQATGPLLDWLDRSVFPEESRFRRTAYARSVASEFVARMLAAGTTTAAVFSSSHEQATATLLEQVLDSGMRAAVGLTLMDQRCPSGVRVSREKAFAASRRLVRRYHEREGRLRFVVTPRFALSCSRALLRQAGRFSRDEGLLVQTHIGETEREEQQTLKYHRYASDYLDVYDRAGLVHEGTVLAHAIHLNERAWDRIAEKGAAVVHCPDSNFFLGSGRFDIRAPQSRGVAVALGSDVAAGRSFSLRRAMASAYDNALCLQAEVPLDDLFEAATLGGARALGWAEQIGSLEVGKEADAVAFRLQHPPMSKEHALAQLIFDTDACAVERVFVRGRALR